MLTVGSLFSGIGGLELGLERTGGFKTIWQCEFDIESAKKFPPNGYPALILKKHWPNIPNLGDITKVDWNGVEKPDVICGGFPCQDISIAGKGKGIREGARSGLWREYARAIRALRPKYVVVENVPEIVNRGLDFVLLDLAALGYDAEWQIISAAECGAPHLRERIFIIAHADDNGTYRQDGEEERRGRLPAEPEYGLNASNPNSSSAKHEIRTGGNELASEIPIADTSGKRCGAGGNNEREYESNPEGKQIENTKRGGGDFGMTLPRIMRLTLPTLLHSEMEKMPSGGLYRTLNEKIPFSFRKSQKNLQSLRASKIAEGLRTCETDPIYLNPSFAEVLMGFPLGWSELSALEMQSFQHVRKS